MADQRKSVKITKTVDAASKTETIIEETIMANGMKTVKKTIRTYVPASANSDRPNDLSKQFKTLTMAEPVKSKKEISQKEFETKLVKDHNEYRAKHGAPPLELSRELCNFAREWATKLATTSTMQHRPNNKYGENLFNGFNVNPLEASSMWYAEVQCYEPHFGREPPKNEITNYGHFSQMVWKKSRKIGAAFVYSADNTLYLVANYDPPGNVIGAFAANVLAPRNVE